MTRKRMLFATYIFAAAVGVLSAALPMRAADAYVVQGYAQGPFIDQVAYVTWNSDAFFANSGSATATVRLLGVSNGAIPANVPRQFTIEPGRTASFSTTAGYGWGPITEHGTALWVVHLDVPDNVQVADVMYIGKAHRGESDGPSRFGMTHLPVVTRLVPAGQPQRHLATFLGDPTFIPSRTNVTIYNGGDALATASIEIRSFCDDSAVYQAGASIAPNTVVQITGLPQANVLCRESPYLEPGATYTVVTVDQPSFSFVSSLSNRDIPLTSISVTP